MSDEDIELAVDWTGADGDLVRTIADVGFLEGQRTQEARSDYGAISAPNISPIVTVNTVYFSFYTQLHEG